MKRDAKGAGILLSKRLLMLADMVTPGNRLVDVGCDHGFLPVYLVQKGICPGALAMDVREGPLGVAGEHIREFGLGDYIETRISDGLAQYHAGEADTLVCAGIGGRLMGRILTEGMDKAVRLKEMILQPQSEIPEFRVFLRNSGFRVVSEDAVYEEGKYYFAMKTVYGVSDPGGEVQQLYDLFGERLLEGRHPVLLQYLRQRKAYLERLERSMKEACTERAAERGEEIHRELAAAERALLFFGREGQI